MLTRFSCYLVLLLFSSAAGAQPISLSGYWSGAFIRDGSLQAFTLDIREEAAGLQATATLPYLGDLSLPPLTLQYDPPYLTFRMGRDVVSLLVDPEAGNMRGTITESSRSPSPTRVRSNDGAGAAPPPEIPPMQVFLQRTVRPVQPSLHEEEVQFAAGSVTLAGTLLRPPGPGPHPLIIYVTGRSNGPRRVHETEARILAQRGVAGLIFDSRGTGQSGGDRATLTDEDRFADVLAALDFVSSRSDIDADQIGLFGHSAGGWVIPIVAQRSGKVAFLVFNVGPAVSLAEQQGQVIRELMRRSGQPFTAADYEAAFAYQKRLTELGQANAPWEEFASLVADAQGQSWAAFVDIPENLENTELDYYRRRPGFDSVPALQQTRIPVLALFGADDFVVPPAENVAALERHLQAAGNDAFQAVVFPSAGHGMRIEAGMRGAGAWPEAYYQWRVPPAGYHQTLVDWVLDHVRLASHP